MLCDPLLFITDLKLLPVLSPYFVPELRSFNLYFTPFSPTLLCSVLSLTVPPSLRIHIFLSVSKPEMFLKILSIQGSDVYQANAPVFI